VRGGEHTQLNKGTCTASDQASPAKLAGLRVGDQVTAFNGKPVSNWTQLGDAIRKAPAGSRGHHGEARTARP
jgi:S1-C subfamily serine protease